MAHLLKQLGVAALYALLVHLDHRFLETGTVVSSLEAESGFALAVLLLGGKRYAWGVFLGSILMNVMTAPFGKAVITSSGDTLEMLCGAWLLTRGNKLDLSMQSLHDYLRLLLQGGVAGVGIAANIGVTVLLVSGFITPETFSNELIHWWTGDILGIILVTPLILVFWQTKNDWIGAKRIAEAALLLGLTFLAGQTIFLDWFHDSIGQVAKGYVMFLFITWVAVRLGIRGAVIALTVVAIQALLGAHHGVGSFADDIAQTQLANYWLYTVILSIVGMALATFLAGHKQAEKAVRANETRLKEIIEVMPLALFIKDPASNIILMNRACEEQWGMPFSDLRGTDAGQFFPPEQVALFLAKDKEVFANRQLVDFEENAWNAALGENRVVRTYKKPVFDEAGNPLYLVGMSIDITESKHAEEVSGQAKLIIDNTIDGFWMADMLGNLQGANAAYAKMSGYSLDELAGMHISQLEAKEKSREEVRAHTEKIIAQGFDKFETRHRHKDGHEIDLEVSVNFMPEAQRFFVFLRDISERKQAEKTLRESEGRLRDIMNNASAVIFIKDTAGRFLFINRTFEKLFHVTDAMIKGKTDHDIFPPDMADAFVKNDQMIIRSGLSVELEERVPQDGGIHTYISVKFPLRNGSGEIYAVCGIATDITERKSAEQKLRDLSAHMLSVREEEKASIAREIHDELGGTLTALKMDAHWLLRKLSANGGAAEFIERIKSMSQQIDGAVSAIRRIITDLRPSMLDDLGLLPALEWQAAEFQKHSGIECRVSCIENEDNLDKQRSIALFRILQEALTNVSRHSGASRVEIEFQHSENEVILAISDNGCGIMESHAAASKSYGMLGMAERVEQLGGKIIFSSPSGGGFCVMVILPLPAEEWSI